MVKRVTIQDIADELGLSRNTVSKVINNNGGVAGATRERILRKAVEMGYSQFTYLNDLSGLLVEQEKPAELRMTDTGGAGGRVEPEAADIREPSYPGIMGTAEQDPSDGPEDAKEISVLTGKRLTYSHFATSMLDRFRQEMDKAGYSMRLYQIQPEHLASFALPPDFHRERAAAVVCIEVFERRYAEMVCTLGLPTLFIDGPAIFSDGALPSDQLCMENTIEIARLVNELVHQGKNRIGFVGDDTHCQSFLERYVAFRTAMMFQGIPVNENFCIRTNKREDIFRRVQAMETLPDLFLCANDFKAIDVLDALRGMGKTVPEDVLLCGFDDSPESRRMIPPLTTIHIHKEILAFSAVQLLLSRIQEPNLDYRIVHTQTDLILRESTSLKGGET